MLSFRPVLQEDAPELAAMADEIWNEYFTALFPKDQVDYMLDKYYSQEAIEARIKNKGRCYFFIVDGTTTIGYYAISPHQDSLLVKVYLKSQFRGKGLGKQVMKRIYKITKQEGYKRIYLAVEKNNVAAMHAFTRGGYHVSHSLKSDIGNGYTMDLYILEKEL